MATVLSTLYFRVGSTKLGRCCHNYQPLPVRQAVTTMKALSPLRHRCQQRAFSFPRLILLSQISLTLTSGFRWRVLGKDQVHLTIHKCQALQRWRSLTNGAAGEPSIQSLHILWSRGTGRWLSQQYKNLYIFPECSSSTQQNWGNQEVEPVGPQVVQQGAPYRQWLPRKTVKRAGRRLISKLCQSDERYLLTLQLLILIAGKGKLQLGESEVRKKLIWPPFWKVLVSSPGGACHRSTVIGWRMLTCSLEVNRYHRPGLIQIFNGLYDWRCWHQIALEVLSFHRQGILSSFNRRWLVILPCAPRRSTQWQCWTKFESSSLSATPVSSTWRMWLTSQTSCLL